MLVLFVLRFFLNSLANFDAFLIANFSISMAVVKSCDLDLYWNFVLEWSNCLSVYFSLKQITGKEIELTINVTDFGLVRQLNGVVNLMHGWLYQLFIYGFLLICSLCSFMKMIYACAFWIPTRWARGKVLFCWYAKRLQLCIIWDGCILVL